MGHIGAVGAYFEQRIRDFPQIQKKRSLRHIYRKRNRMGVDFATSKDSCGFRKMCDFGRIGQTINAQFGISPMHNSVDEVKDKDPARKPVFVPIKRHRKL